jgi:glucose-6-phosphate 1-dehydrogenase
VAEQVGLEGRGGYYDSAGAVRDMVQNHIMQVLALVAMEAPATFTAEAVRGEKVKLFQSIRPLNLDAVVRGQYAGYQGEPGVAPGSTTETYAAMRIAIDTWRWAGVPFYLRTGKALPRRLSEVVIQFRQPPLSLFAHADHAGHRGPQGVMEPNILRLRIQPDEAITLQVGLKPPGGAMRLEPVQLGFRYAEGFSQAPPEAYERLLFDAMDGDATLFIRRDEAEAAWALVSPLLDQWAASGAPPLRYDPGSWGPAGATALVAAEGRGWLTS